MIRHLTTAFVLGVCTMVQAEETKKVPAALNFKMKGIDGKEVDLAAFQGKVVMFVNVASECGLTGQYKGLQAIYEKYGKEGLVIVGVPANEFGAQEPGTDAQIKEFCTKNYKVTFPMMSKVAVKGAKICPLYDYLTTKTEKQLQGPIDWNFAKFVVGRNGEVVARFKASVDPEDAKVVETIETELKKK
ncbi:MAG: glutathione peroxidase [Planctomycetia bacterium]|nr:glutathione peroxidase [Planctomycetia bacterium]